MANNTTANCYVASYGNDANSGGQDSPFKTLAKALDLAKKGTVRHIVINGRLNERTEGSAGQETAFIIENTGSNQITISGDNKATLEARSCNGVIRCQGNVNIRFEHIIIKGGKYCLHIAQSKRKHHSEFTGIAPEEFFDKVKDIPLSELDDHCFCPLTDKERKGKALVTLGEGVSVTQSKNMGVFVGSDHVLDMHYDETSAVVFGKSILVIDGGEISENTGRGIIVAGSNNKCIMNGGFIVNNKKGGVLVSQWGRFEMNYGVISGNTCKGKYAETEGGGILVTDESIVEINGGTIGGNSAERGGGICLGGLYGSYGNLKINEGCIMENTADEGGGLYIGEESTLEIKDGLINLNIAKNGGGLYFTRNVEHGSYFISGGIITFNKAFEDGGGIYLGGGVLKITGDVKIMANTAYSHGGGILVGDFFESYPPAKLVLSDKAEISGNTAGSEEKATGNNDDERNRGGGICVNEGILQMRGGRISSNFAHAGGGVSFGEKSMYKDKESVIVFKFSGGHIFDNEADKGGGVYYVYYGKDRFEKSGGEISSNSPDDVLKEKYIWVDDFIKRKLSRLI
jgi:hypothetical protein